MCGKQGVHEESTRADCAAVGGASPPLQVPSGRSTHNPAVVVLAGLSSDRQIKSISSRTPFL
jgi:hypothetical protein